MLSSIYVEDIFLSFYRLVHTGQINVQHQDFSPILSFHTKIEEDSPLTKNQADYVVKILEKYKNLAQMCGVDYYSDLQSATWKHPFRVLDLSKKIYVEKSETGKLEICLKFPYQLKKEFDEEINVNLPNSHRTSHWDPDDKVRRLNFYDFNLISLYEFAVKHNFEIDDTFMNVMADVEEIWQNSDDVVPFSEITNSGIQLRNANEDAIAYWHSQITESFTSDMLLAKSMGFVLRKTPETLIEKIASSQENSFWIKNNSDLLSISSCINGKICIILDRTSNTVEWLRRFVADADKCGINRDEIKVCFREGKDSKSGINEWIKAAGVGGKVDDGKILIFETKPAKWLFKESNDVKLLVTNNVYPPTNNLAKDWFNSHPCVIYLGDTKPTEQRGQKIVEL